ncbi:MAG: hypothetical protein ACFE92_17450 [Promethearchaeota archaeon]
MPEKITGKSFKPKALKAAKGIGWRAVSNWQIEHRRDILGLEDETPDERIKAIDQLLKIVKDELIKILEDPTEKSLIDSAIKDIMEFYKKEYAFC